MSNDIVQLVPNEIQTVVAIADAERTISQAKGEPPWSYDGLIEQGKFQERMVARAVLDGDDLAQARSWALRVALIRDARPTHAEAYAAQEAVAA